MERAAVTLNLKLLIWSNKIRHIYFSYVYLVSLMGITDYIF